MKRYKAVLISPDGDWTTDYRFRGTVEEVEAALASQGSRWYFYPFHAVILDHGQLTTERQRLVSVADPFAGFARKSVKTFAEYISHLPAATLQAIIEG